MSAHVGDFLFTGVAVLPPALALGGYFGAAMLVFLPLLIAACLASSHADGPTSPPSSKRRDGNDL